MAEIKFFVDPKWDGLDKALAVRKARAIRQQIEALVNDLEDAVDPNGYDLTLGGPVLLINNAFSEMQDAFEIIEKALDN